MNKKIKFSIIIPVVNEESTINKLLQHIHTITENHSHEIIVIDGDRTGSTLQAITDHFPVKKLISMKMGRADQMNYGAGVAKGEILVFLHADTHLPDNAFSRIHDALHTDIFYAGAFTLKIQSYNPLLHLIAGITNIRSQLSRVPYGDQVFFMKKKFFNTIGKFKSLSIMEDVEIMERIKKAGYKICILNDKVVTSPRRWQKNGVIRNTVKNRFLILLYKLGIPHTTLKEIYENKK